MEDLRFEASLGYIIEFQDTLGMPQKKLKLRLSVVMHEEARGPHV